MKKLLFFLPFVLFAEVNPFGAGLNSNYGLTPQEKAILKNKKDISNLRARIRDLEDELGKLKLKLANYDDLINQKLSGFSTIIDELNLAKKNIQSLNKKDKIHDEEIQRINEKIASLEGNITSIKASIKEIIKIQNQNFNTLKEAIDEILKSVKKPTSITPKEAHIKAKHYFFANKLEKAKELFLYSLQHNYRPATSAYYLGEIAFKKKNYKEALAFYKKSVEIYPKKTSFTPRLLYHSAIAFLKLNQKDNAKLTLKKLIHDFPSSKYANLAKKELEKIK